MFGINYKYLAAAVVLFIAMVIIALFFQGGFLRNHFGDILVVMFIVCTIRSIIRPRMKWLCLAVFIFATLVEIGQYFDLVGLLGLTGNALAETIIGTTFDPWDILMYAIGCLIMYVIERCRDRRYQI
ncbi:MAG: DUF2809 domain-containing protein [Defluviitaleaceae bacterium]|nr:DUF2809 domain-containing protein [Defluviitaleaceae bacterium]